MQIVYQAQQWIEDALVELLADASEQGILIPIDMLMALAGQEGS
jgi:hypothetical protein